jgi:hypothetical protein
MGASDAREEMSYTGYDMSDGFVVGDDVIEFEQGDHHSFVDEDEDAVGQGYGRGYGRGASRRAEGAQRDEEATDEHSSICEACEEGGFLLCCDTCTRAWHLLCVSAYPGYVPENLAVSSSCLPCFPSCILPLCVIRTMCYPYVHSAMFALV